MNFVHDLATLVFLIVIRHFGVRDAILQVGQLKIQNGGVNTISLVVNSSERKFFKQKWEKMTGVVLDHVIMIRDIQTVYKSVVM